MKRKLILLAFLLILSANAFAAYPVTLNDELLGNNGGDQYSYISTSTTTTIKTGAGYLKRITVEGGSAGTIIVYDNTAASGTVIASFDSTNALASYTIEAPFATGLTVITSAATKITVSYL